MISNALTEKCAREITLARKGCICCTDQNASAISPYYTDSIKANNTLLFSFCSSNNTLSYIDRKVFAVLDVKDFNTK